MKAHNTEVYNRRWRLVGLAYSGLLALGLVDGTRGPIFPDLLKEFSLSDSFGSLFFLVSSASGFLNNVLLLRWIEKIGPFRTTQVYCLGQAFGLATIGLGQSYLVLLFGSAILGASFGGLGISLNQMVAEEAHEKYRRRALSGLHCMYGISSLLSPLIISILYRFGYNWRVAAGLVSSVPLMVLAASFLVISKVEASKKTRIRQEQHSNKIGTASDGNHQPRDWAAVGFFSMLCTLAVVGEISISAWLALYARRVGLYPPGKANLLVAMFFAGLFLGRLILALVPTQWSSLKMLTASVAASLVFASLGLLVSPIFLALTGLAMSIFYPSAIALISELRQGQGGDAAYVTSWCVTMQAVGVMAMHFMVGRISDRFGLAQALWVGPICLAVALVFLTTKSRFLSPKTP